MSPAMCSRERLPVLAPPRFCTPLLRDTGSDSIACLSSLQQHLWEEEKVMEPSGGKGWVLRALAMGNLKVA